MKCLTAVFVVSPNRLRLDRHGTFDGTTAQVARSVTRHLSLLKSACHAVAGCCCNGEVFFSTSAEGSFSNAH
jgi:hypothetical protein